MPKITAANKGEKIIFTPQEQETLRNAGAAAKKFDGWAAIFSPKMQATFATQINNAKGIQLVAAKYAPSQAEEMAKKIATGQLIEPRQGGVQSIQSEDDYQTIAQNYRDKYDALYKKLDVFIKMSVEVPLEAYEMNVIINTCRAYDNAYNSFNDTIKEHGDQLKASADAAAALTAIVIVGVLAVASTSGVILKIFDPMLRNTYPKTQYVNTLAIFEKGINVAEDIIQISADKFITTNVTAYTPKYTPVSPFRAYMELSSELYNNWISTRAFMLDMLNLLRLENAAFIDMVTKSYYITSAQNKKIEAQYEAIEKQLEDIIDTVTPRVPKTIPIDIEFWTLEFELYLWSQFIPKLRTKAAPVNPNSRMADYHENYDYGNSYASISWALVGRWRQLGIITETSFAAGIFNSWNDDIDQVITWANNYKLPSFK